MIAWGADLTSQDANGMTALHLAVDNVEKVGDTSLVRHLLLRGANRTLLDKKGRSVANLALELRESTVRSEILDFL